jgi:lipopolysaccharide transport system ATP-binding protein
MKPMISIENLGKSYLLGGPTHRPNTMTEAFMAAARAPIERFRNRATGGRKEFWALRDVSFDINRGEVIGIIGRNGAGKSTLLKCLSRITEPTEGKATLRGRVASLLEVGTGFHPELTGRENVYLNGSILGMRKTEIDRKFDEIVDFSGVEKFLDTPVKRYSSGMYVRLAFAVAAHLEPEILIVDEVLAVGDAEFQKKCLGKMQEVASGVGRTVLFVSHNMDAVLALCSTVVVFESGKSSGKLPPNEGVKRYLASTSGDADGPLRERPRFQSEKRPYIITDVAITGSRGDRNITPVAGGLEIVLDLENCADVANVEVGIVITDAVRHRVVVFQSRYHAGLQIPGKDKQQVRCIIPSLPLVPGLYYIDLAIGDGFTVLERIEQAIRIEVVFEDLFGTGKLPNSSQGYLVVPSEWSLR